MFHIKICGVKTAHDIAVVAESGADAIGLNFYPPSIRYLDPLADTTAELARSADELGLTTVGVFVNVATAEIASIANTLRLDAAQLHGDESVQSATALVEQGISVVKAIKLPGKVDHLGIQDRCKPWADAGCHLLLDADAGSAHGGVGQSVDWLAVGKWQTDFPGHSWSLAGGLRVDNVQRAIRETGASSIDVASGVESPRGTKSKQLIVEMAELAKRAFVR